MRPSGRQGRKGLACDSTSFIQMSRGQWGSAAAHGFHGEQEGVCEGIDGGVEAGVSEADMDHGGGVVLAQGSGSQTSPSTALPSETPEEVMKKGQCMTLLCLPESTLGLSLS